MLAYIFILEGAAKITSYAGVVDYMQSNGVDGRLLPLVILTELGGGLLVLFGLWTRWAAIALSGYCLLTALIFHMGADQAIQFNKNIAMAGGFLALAVLGPGAWSLDAWRGRDPLGTLGTQPFVSPRAEPAASPCGGLRPRPIERPSASPCPWPRHLSKATNVERRRQADQQPQARRQGGCAQ